ncbi:MAG: sigma-70 family RNA polymerase sigma factor [Aureispira sp.]|nr:sigma-70 family RNA polymerase sigma factor [Aureispira sp.]
MNDSQQLGKQLKELHTESFGWALRCCYNQKLEAEDILQMVYLKILEGRAQYRNKSSFKTWLFSVIRNTAIDQHRKKKWTAVPLEVVKDLADDSVDQYGTEQQELKKLFRLSLEQLSDKQREIMQLVFYHDFTIKEAANIMGTSIGSARKHYDRAKQKLRILLKERAAWKALLLN